MSPSAGRDGRSTPGRAPASVAAGEHVHRWDGVDFYLEGGRPFVRQSCRCGASRAFRAWEVYWDPAVATGSGTNEGATATRR